MNIIMSRAHIPHRYPHRLPPPLSPTSPLDFTDRISFNELELLPGYLGRGSYGTVVKGRWRGRTVAVKQFKERTEIDSFLIEVKQLSSVKHPNIVTLYGACTLSDTAYLVMEYAEGGSLNHLLHESDSVHYDLRHACSWAMQAAKGVAYLHGLRPKPIMHRDLKPANLLLFSQCRILKICDFGTACAVKTQMTNNTGSASYMAPEVFGTVNYSESGDVFSWSIIFWEILARRHPYPQYSQPLYILYNVNMHNLRPLQFESCGGLNYCPDIIWDLITMCWVKPPEARPRMQQVADRMELIFSLTDNSHVNHLHQNNNHQNSSSTSNQQEMKSPQGRQFCRLLPQISLHPSKGSSGESSSNRSHKHQQTTSSKFMFNCLNQSSHHNSKHYEHSSRNNPLLRPWQTPSTMSSIKNDCQKINCYCSECNSNRHKILRLHQRFEGLKGVVSTGSIDRWNPDRALKEYQDLKRQTELLRHELRASNKMLLTPKVQSPVKSPKAAPATYTSPAASEEKGREV